MIKGLLIVIMLFFITGCVSPKEAVRGVLGVSTKTLEEKRSEALKKEFPFDLIASHAKLIKILKDNGSYIYSDDLEHDLIALYISYEDTTPVGIFLTEVENGKTLIEVSSPSTYGKENIAGVVFGALDRELKEAKKKGSADASQK